MNKTKILLLSFFSLILALISSVVVYAQQFYEQPGAAIGEALYSALGWLTIDISRIGVDDPATFYARFLIWIVIFAALYFASLFIFKDQKKIAVAISAVLAIVGAVAIPDIFVKTIFESYALFFAITLIALPVVGLFYLGRKIQDMFPNSPKAVHLINALLFWFLLTLFNGFNQGIKAGSEKGIFKTLYQYDAWFGFAFALCLILMLWHFAALIMGFGGEAAGAAGRAAERAAEEPGGIRGIFGRAANAARRAWRGERMLEIAEFRDLTRAQRLMHDNASITRNRIRILNLLSQAEAMQQRAETLNAFETRITQMAERIGERATAHRNEIISILRPEAAGEVSLAQLFEDITAHINTVRDIIRHGRMAHYATARRAINEAVGLEARVIQLTTRLNELATELQALEREE